MFDSGRFALTDSTLTLSPIVAKSPNFMAGGSDRYRYLLRGDTLWVHLRSEDEHIRVGDRLVSPSAAYEVRLMLQRRQ